MKSEEQPTNQTLRKVDSLITKTRGQFLEDGIIEIWAGMYLIITATYGFVDQNFQAYYTPFLIFYIAFAVVFGCFLSLWFWRKSKLTGIAGIPSWVMIGFLYFPLLELPRQTAYYMYTPMVVHFIMSLAIFYFTRFRRFLIYAAWAVASWFVAGFIHDNLLTFPNWYNTYQIAVNGIAPMLFGAVIFTKYYRKNMVGKLFVFSSSRDIHEETDITSEAEIAKIRQQFLAERKRKIGFNFNHGIPDMMIAVLISLIAWGQYSFSISNMVLLWIVLILAIIVVGFLGSLWYRMISIHNASLGLWRGASRLLILNIIFFALGLMVYNTFAAQSIPIISLLMIVVVFIVIASLSRIIRYWIYSAWSLTSLLVVSFPKASSSGSVVSDPFWMFSMLLCVPMFAVGLYLLMSFFKKHPLGGSGHKATTGLFNNVTSTENNHSREAV